MDPSKNSTKKSKLKLTAPTKAETGLLPPFAGLTIDQIQVPQTPRELSLAVEIIKEAGICGFDTEAKPTFSKGEKSEGPHIVQFALENTTYIFQLHHEGSEQAASEILASQEVLKVGFGLKNDHAQIHQRLGISLQHTLDLDQIFRKLGYGGQIGVRGAIGVLLGQGFKKSKSITTSNWALPELRPKQLLYAANDAYAALKVMEALRANGHIE